MQWHQVEWTVEMAIALDAIDIPTISLEYSSSLLKAFPPKPFATSSAHQYDHKMLFKQCKESAIFL